MSLAFRVSLGIVAGAAIAGTVLVARSGTVREVADNPVAPLPRSGLYEQAEAVARSRLNALRKVRGETSLPVANAVDELVRALRLNGKSTAEETLRLSERALRTKRAHLGEFHAGTAVSLLNRGQVLADAGDYRAAIDLVRQALDIHDKLPEPDRNLRAIAEILDALGLILTRARFYDQALNVLNRSLEIKQAGGLVNNESLIETLVTVVGALQGRGDYRAARECLDRVLSMQRHAGSHPSQLPILNVLALQLYFEGSLLESRDTSIRAVALARKTLRADHPEAARALRALAATIDDLGDTGASLAYREQALDIAQRSLGETHYELAAYLNDLGNLNLLLGNYVEARQRFERALRIALTRLGPTHEWIPMIVHNLALVDASLGDLPGARQQHLRATEKWEHVLGPDHPFVAIALTELATVLREQGAAAEALSLFERALAIRERAVGGRHRDTGRTLVDIAATLTQLGDIDRAQPIADRALSIWEGLDAGNAPELALVLQLYGDLQLARGSVRGAQRLFERALQIRRSAFGPGHPLVAETQARLGLVHATVGNGIEALAAANQAESIGREHLRLMLRHLPERQSLNYAATRPNGLHLILSMAATPESTSVALDALIRSRALVLDEMAARRQIGRAPSDASASHRAQLTSAQQRLANLAVRGPRGLSLDQYTALMTEARGNKEEAERALAARSASFRSELGRSRSGLHEVRSQLPGDAALVSIVRHSRVALRRPPSAPPASFRQDSGVPAYTAFVLRRGSEPVAVPLGPADAIDSLVTNWRQDMASGSARDHAASRAAEESIRTSGRKLRAAIWDPLVPHLGRPRMVFIVPDGALGLVPFAALPGSGAEFLLEEGPVLHYLSAERDLLADSRSAGAGGLLAVGGPDFDGSGAGPPVHARASPQERSAYARTRAATSCQGFDALRFDELTGSFQEVEEISRLWAASTPAARAPRVRVLTAAEADERTVKQEAARHGVLHLATHGFFLGDACRTGDSGFRQAGDPPETHDVPPASAVLSSADNPLLLSGLALAGANQRASAGVDDEDGILTAEEVAALDLENVEWAVLSACGTGIGEIRAGEGVFGLRRAFQVAGARTVVMSLWSVDDQATRMWMRALYEGRLTRRLGTADAVREAGLAVLRHRRETARSTHPFYWGAFVAAGDWR